MAIPDLIRALFPRENPTQTLAVLDAKLSDLRTRRTEAELELAARETSARAKNVETTLAGGKVAVSKDMMEAREHLAALVDTIAALEGRRAEAETEAAAERKAEAIAACVKAKAETEKLYITAWSIVALGAKMLHRIGAVPPIVSGGPTAAYVEVYGVPQGVSFVSYTNPARAAYEALAACGGDYSDLPAETSDGYPFGSNTKLDTASIEKLLSRILPAGGLDGLGRAAREAAAVAAAAEADQLAKVEDRRRRWRECIAAAVEAWKGKTASDISDVETYRDACCLHCEARNLEIPCSRLTQLLVSVEEGRQAKGEGGSWSWSVNSFRAGKVAGWVE